MVTLSQAVCDLHDPSAAAGLYEQLRPVAGQVGVLALMTDCAGSYSLYCGMLAACLHRWDDAAHHFADALAMNERLGARPRAHRRRPRRSRSAQHGARGRALPAAAGGDAVTRASIVPAIRVQLSLDAMEMNTRTLREWLEARRAAEAREQAERRDTHSSPTESLRQAMQLIAFASRLHGWPLPDDGRSLHEDQLGYRRWERLRAAWRRNGGGLH